MVRRMGNDRDNPHSVLMGRRARRERELQVGRNGRRKTEHTIHRLTLLSLIVDRETFFGERHSNNAIFPPHHSQ